VESNLEVLVVKLPKYKDQNSDSRNSLDEIYMDCSVGFFRAYLAELK
jgi:hypothetical protein